MACEMGCSLFDALETEFGKQLADVRIDVKEVKLKIGNEISTVSLR
jgi:hypothetical protein